MGRRLGTWLSRMLASSGLQPQALQSGAQADRTGGVAKGNAGDVQAVHGHLLVVQDAHAGASRRLKVVLLAAELLVVAGGKVNAEGRREFLEGRGQAVEIGHGSVKQVAGDEDDVRLQASAAMATMRRLNPTPLMLPRCRSLSSTALRPRQLSGRPGSVTAIRRTRIRRAFSRP